MNKAQLVDSLSAHFDGNKRQAGQALESVLQTITTAVSKGDKVSITGFGVFEKVVRQARVARNPRTGESVRVKKTSAPKFRPGADFKALVSGAKKPPKAPTVKKAAAKKATAAKSTAAKKTTAARTTAAKKTTAAKTTAAKRTTAAKTAVAKKATPARKTTAKKATPAKKTTARKTAAKRAR